MCYICEVNFKWYIGALVSMIAIFVVQQQEMVTPNQEIALHFTNDFSSLEKEEQSIVQFTSQLEDTGATVIKVVKKSNGRYTFSYYSEHNVSSIKEKLEVDVVNYLTAISGQPVKLPSQEDRAVFQIDIYDIQQDTNGVAGADPALFFELKLDFNRGSQVNQPSLVKTIYSSDDRIVEQLIKSANHTQGLTVSSRCYAIPAVRAGPSLS